MFDVPPCQVVTPKPTPAPQVVTDDWNFWLAIFIYLIVIVIIAFIILVCCVWKFVKSKDNSEAETEVQTKPKADQDPKVGNQVKKIVITPAEKPKDGLINDDLPKDQQYLKVLLVSSIYVKDCSMHRINNYKSHMCLILNLISQALYL